jgi:uncharacterized protein
MDKSTEKKLARLRKHLNQMGSALVALSGGVDSSVLLKIASASLPGKIVAVTARSPLNPPGELEMAREVAKASMVRHVEMDFAPLALEAIRTNQPDRCYHCKTALAGMLKSLASELGLAEILEGSHKDDMNVHRPGVKALIESGIKSPLADAALTKAELRKLAHIMGLPNWDAPSQACLATRFPYGTTLDKRKLEQVYKAERHLARIGLPGVRARHHGDILRLEFPPEYMTRLGEKGLQRRLVRDLSRLDFRFVTVDLAGYISGGFDSQET